MPIAGLASVQHELPWEVAFTQRMGRHAVAKHKLEPGELLLLERAVACVPIRGETFLKHWPGCYSACCLHILEVASVLQGLFKLDCRKAAVLISRAFLSWKGQLLLLTRLLVDLVPDPASK